MDSCQFYSILLEISFIFWMNLNLESDWRVRADLYFLFGWKFVSYFGRLRGMFVVSIKKISIMSIESLQFPFQVTVTYTFLLEQQCFCLSKKKEEKKRKKERTNLRRNVNTNLEKRRSKFMRIIERQSTRLITQNPISHAGLQPRRIDHNAPFPNARCPEPS